MRRRPEKISDILAATEHWPKKGDRLFKSASDRFSSATFTQHFVSREAYIWDGYMKAGETLIEVCIEESQERDALIFPILFNYRHATEVAMKWLIDRYGSAFYRDVRYDKNHNLLELWRICRGMFDECGVTDVDAMDAVEQIILDFHELDKTGQKFRYSKSLDNKLFDLPSGQIDLENLYWVMRGVNLFFEGSDGMLDGSIANIGSL